MINPDKFVRKYFFDALNATIPVFDANTVDFDGDFYIVLSNQTKDIIFDNKCYDAWQTSITIEIIEITNGTKNKGSRVRINDAENLILSAYNNVNISNFDLIHKEYNSNSIVTNGINQVIDRQIITINLKLK